MCILNPKTLFATTCATVHFTPIDLKLEVRFHLIPKAQVEKKKNHQTNWFLQKRQESLLDVINLFALLQCLRSPHLGTTLHVECIVVAGAGRQIVRATARIVRG